MLNVCMKCLEDNKGVFIFCTKCTHEKGKCLSRKGDDVVNKVKSNHPRAATNIQEINANIFEMLKSVKFKC